jgi:hypothetical protein
VAGKGVPGNGKHSRIPEMPASSAVLTGKKMTKSG